MKRANGLVALFLLGIAACGEQPDFDAEGAEAADIDNDAKDTAGTMPGKGIMPVKGFASTATQNLVQAGIQYHNGPIMTQTANIYLIWYGNWSNNTTTTIIHDLASNLGTGIPYMNINTTYTDVLSAMATNKAVLAGEINDNYSYGTSLSDSTIKTIINSHVGVGKEFTADPNGVYFLITSSDVNATSGLCTQYCGWHTYDTLGGTANLKYSFLGDPARCIANCADESPNAPNGNVAADALASSFMHELVETISDPLLTAWYDTSGQENADKCAFTFGSTYSTPNGSHANMTIGTRNYLIQRNWINEGSGVCGLSHSAPTDVTAPVTSLTAPPNPAVGTLVLSATATDSVGVIKVEFYDGTTLIGTDTTSPYSFSWDTTTVVDGAHTLKTKAYDAAGNVGTSATKSTTILNTPVTLTNGIAVTSISGSLKSTRYYSLVVPAGKTNLSFATSGGTGDVDMYVRKSALPTSSSYDCALEVAGNTETCTFNNPIATTYYVMLYGYAAYSGVSLTGTYTASYTDNFTTDSLLNYEIVDLGPNAGPSAWSVSGGVMNQTSNIYGDGSRELGEEGTYAVRKDILFSNDQTHEIRLKSSDNDGMGLVWNWVDSNNFYHVYWDATNNRIAFTKVIGGVATRVAYVAQSRVASQWYTLRVTTTGSTINVYLDNTLILTTSDSSLTSGRAGFFTVGNIGTAFDDYSASSN